MMKDENSCFKIEKNSDCNMDKCNPCLLNVPVFAELDTEMLIEISDLIRPVFYEDNEVIYNQGDLIEDLSIVYKGSVKLLSSNEAGKQRIVKILLHGDYFGETSLLTSQKTEFKIVAIEDTWIHNLKLEAFRKLMLTNEKMTLSMLQSLIDQIADRDEEVAKSSLIPAYDRVYDALLHYSDFDGMVNLPISKQDLANSLGITPETFSRSLNKLEKDQRIIKHGQDIEII